MTITAPTLLCSLNTLLYKKKKNAENVPLVCEEDTKFEGSLELEIVLLRRSLTFWELHIIDHRAWLRMSVKLVCCLNK